MHRSLTPLKLTLIIKMNIGWTSGLLLLFCWVLLCLNHSIWQPRSALCLLVLNIHTHTYTPCTHYCCSSCGKVQLLLQLGSFCNNALLESLLSLAEDGYTPGEKKSQEKTSEINRTLSSSGTAFHLLLLLNFQA